MPAARVRIGIVGCGKISDNHFQAYRRNPAVEVVAVCDVEPARAREFAAARGIPAAVGSVRELIGLGVDAISVCTPHPTHEAVVLEAVEHGVHVLCEKPLSITSGSVARMIDAAAEHGVVLATVFQRRFWEAARRIRSALDEGLLGTPMLGGVQVLLSRGAEYYDSAPWRGTWAADGGGALMTQSVHYIDLLTWYFGAPVEVSAKAGNFTHGDAIEVEDTAAAVVTFASGAIATVAATVSASPNMGMSLTLTGSNGATVRLSEYPEGSDARIEFWAVPGALEAGEAPLAAGFRADKTVDEVNADLQPLHARQLDDFVDALRHGRSPAVTGADAIRSLHVIEAIYESARTGRAVRIPGPDDAPEFEHLAATAGAAPAEAVTGA